MLLAFASRPWLILDIWSFTLEMLLTFIDNTPTRVCVCVHRVYCVDGEAGGF